MKTLIAALGLGLIISNSTTAFADWSDEKTELKEQIIALAKTFEGQGDPDFSKQRALDPLVQQLLAIAAQPPVQQRLSILVGSWKQVWGPYDYKNDDRGVDPELGTEEIYQVISPDGYYYNVSYLYKNGDKENKRIGLLRGEYELNPIEPNSLKVKFTDYPGASQKSDDLELWQLPELAENGTLPNQITIVPSFVVKLFFGGGNLREVYTDNELRIIYGSSNRSPENESIYIMTRVQ